MSQRLEEIIKTFEVIEKENLIDDPDIRDWMRELVRDEFGLVCILVQTFLENIKDDKVVKDILKVIR
jgi:hypothetical protein